MVVSTERMGVGTNAQEWTIPLHHLDCLWRPVDLLQSEGGHSAPGQPEH